MDIISLQTDPYIQYSYLKILQQKYNNIADFYPIPYEKYFPLNITGSSVYNPQMVWYCDKNKLFIPYKLNDYFSYFIKSSKKRYFIIMLHFFGYSQQKTGHCNVLIYDKKSNILSRFEPNGYMGYGKIWYYSEKLDTKLISFVNNLKKNYTVSINYNSPCKYMPGYGPQHAQYTEYLKHNLKNDKDPIGFCVSWVFLFLEFSLNNPNISLKNICKHMLKYKTDYIRNYSQYMMTHI